MHAIRERAETLQKDITDAVQRIGLIDLEKELVELRLQSQDPNLWSDNLHAQEIMKQISRLESRVQPWREIEKSVFDILEIAELGGDGLEQELQAQLHETQQRYNKLKRELKFSGEYDESDAIVSIHAGAGGTDAQDWAQMLLRMYIRWAEANNLQTEMIDESAGEEAGIKSTTFEISGNFAYGKLKGEHGVHRLVRLSPFNADNLRQTSFAKVEVMPKIDKPERVEIDEKDLKIDVYRSGGKGGQSVNTTDSAVRVTHMPTGIVVAIQNERSQIQNKETALTILRSKLAQLQQEQHLENLSELKGPNQSAEWGNQIRSYVLHPYKQVKDLRTKQESSDPDAVLDGDLNAFIDAFLEDSLGDES
jgi:peptide chain release factor 2